MMQTIHRIEPSAAALISAAFWLVFLMRLSPQRRWLWLLPLLMGAACKRWLQTPMIWIGGLAAAVLPANGARHSLAYFIFNIGLREETIKLLCMLPLLFWLRRGKNRKDGLLAGALVGLGFACEENRWFFSGHPAALLLVGRTLGATALHLGLSGLTGHALLDMLQQSSRGNRARFGAALACAIVIHGIYDWSPVGGPAALHTGGTSAISLLMVMLVLAFFIHRARMAGDTWKTAFIFALATVTLTAISAAMAAIGPPGSLRVCLTEALWFMPVVVCVLTCLRPRK